jgi:long-chain acyl-CoA synthetase
MLDLPVVSAILPKKIRKRISAPAAHDYFYKKSLTTWLFRTGFNMFPIKRFGNYFDGLKICTKKIKEGKPLIVFPEGTRSVSGELQKFKPGIGFLAHDLNVPIIPVYIKGAYEALPKGSVFPRPGKIQIIVGEPVNVPEFKNVDTGQPNYPVYQNTTEKVRRAIELLIEENK